MAELLRCIELSKSYKEQDNRLQVLKNINLSIEQGEKVAVLGSSGSGKSTLLHILGTLDQPSSGQVLFKGQDVFALSRRQQAAFRNRSLGFVYQFHHLLPEFSALENAAMPLLIAKVSKSDAFAKAEALLQRVGLAQRMTHKPAQLSGGERQRVAIARALVTEPELVLADEPTGNLDDKTGAEIYALIEELQGQMGTSFLVVTHDLALAKRLDRIVQISDGTLLQA